MWEACQQGKKFDAGRQLAIPDTMRLGTRPGNALVGQAANPSPTLAAPDSWHCQLPQPAPEAAEGAQGCGPQWCSSPALLTSGPADCPFLLQSGSWLQDLAPVSGLCPLLASLCAGSYSFPTHPAGCDPQTTSAYTGTGSSALPPLAVTTLQVLSACLSLSTELSVIPSKQQGRLDFIHSPPPPQQTTSTPQLSHFMQKLL